MSEIQMMDEPKKPNDIKAQEVGEKVPFEGKKLRKKLPGT
jgi:hypothetical protein